ncbi:MAG: hypothetical protein HKN70_09245 [Gammaproteobacteria bacterium]|nr:hypothetical protein [Gammaproteobacteria bacterium]
MPEIKNASVWSMAILLLSACGTGDACDRPQEYVYSKSGQQLVVPPDMSRPDPSKNRQIPPLSGERKERSDPCSVLPPQLVVAKAAEPDTDKSASPDTNRAVQTSASAALEIGEPFNGDPRATLDAWINAWARADIPAYLAFYSQDYRSPDDIEERESWLLRRKELIESTGPAEISIRDVTLEDLALGRILVRLVQDFNGSEGARSIVKIMELVPEGGGYRIRHEWVVGFL